MASKKVCVSYNANPIRNKVFEISPLPDYSDVIVWKRKFLEIVGKDGLLKSAGGDYNTTEEDVVFYRYDNDFKENFEVENEIENGEELTCSLVQRFESFLTGNFSFFLLFLM